jgi:DNA polymerase-3 subunit gamma/tau
MLSSQAFNAFLKTLEEPPSYAKFILATTEKHKILPTILSRCQIYDFKRISVLDIQNHLQSIATKEGIDAESSALNVIAQKADGGLRDALSMFDRLTSLNDNKLLYSSVIQNLNILDHDYYFKFVDLIKANDTAGLVSGLHEVLGSGFELEAFIDGFSAHVRNLWMTLKPETLSLLEYNPEIIQKYKTQAALFSEAVYLNMLQIISDCEKSLPISRQKKLSVELMLLKLAYVQNIMNTSWMNLEVEKKK